MIPFFFLLLVAFSNSQRVCTPTDPNDTPFTTGCLFCNISAPVGEQGCFNGGTCYSDSVNFAPATIDICGCPQGFAPPACLQAVPVVICDPFNQTQQPPSCSYCEIGSGPGEGGCDNGGQCYYATFLGPGQPAPPPPGLPLCNCPPGFSAPTCTFETPFCNVSAGEAPPACQYCNPTLPVGSQGCQNGGECYFERFLPGQPPLPEPGLPICGCPFGFEPPTCEFASPPRPICDPTNQTDLPPNCIFCDLNAEVGSQGCANGGICYVQKGEIPGFPPLPPTGIPLCGCPFGFAPPSCTFPLPELPYCNTSDPTDVPPNCNYCNPLINEGCANGGTCYVATSIPGQDLPPTGLPICGCSYEWSEPRCDFRRVPQRFCNASDPTNPLENPPFCQFCDPFAAQSPNGNNGCVDFGRCQLAEPGSPFLPTDANQTYPPNFQLPICDCQQGLVPPQCAQDLLEANGRSDLKNLRFLFMVFYLVPTILSLLVLVQHAYFAINYKLTKINLSKAIGAFCIMMCGVVSIISVTLNPYAWVFGYPTEYDVISYALLLTSLLAFLVIGVAINTANWLRVGMAAINPRYRRSEGWPVVAKIMVWTVVVIQVVLAIFFAVTIIPNTYYVVFFYVSAGIGLTLCLFSVVFGTFVLVTIKQIETADPKLLRNTATQLVVVSSAITIATLVLIFISYTSASAAWGASQPFSVIFGVNIVMPVLVQTVFMILLLIPFRIAQWQLKEVALTRGNTVTGTGFDSASARDTAQSYNEEGVEAMSKSKKVLSNFEVV